MVVEANLNSAIEHSTTLLISGRHRENLEFLESAVERFPEDPEIRMLHATCLVEFRPSDVAKEVHRAIELDPDEPIRLTRAANLLLSMGEAEAARSYGARASELIQPGFPLQAELLSLGALLAVHDGKDELAEESLREVLDFAPGEERFVKDLTRFLVDRGRVGEAIEVVDNALPLAPDPKEAERLTRLRGELGN